MPKEAKNHHPDPDQVERLWRQWRYSKDASARNRLVLSFAPMAKYLAARKVRGLPAHCELDDLVSAGLLGLLAALDRFDPSKGVPLEQYVWTRISGAILDELRRQDWAPRSMRRTQREIEAVQAEWTARTGSPANDAQLAGELGIDQCALRDHFRRLEQAEVQSLNDLRLGHEEQLTEVGELLVNTDDRLDPERMAMAVDKARAWKRAISVLSKREQQIFLLAVVEDRQGMEIAEVLGVSPSRISQMLTGIRYKLTKELGRYDAGESSFLEAA